ncbi:MAG: hypothetical protein GY870_12435 [archaeon]|nr:hypothetical protein [archaeon]
MSIIKDLTTLNKSETMEMCLLAKNGIECGLWMAQTDLENHILGTYELQQKDLGNLYLLKNIMRTVKKVCLADNMIKQKNIDVMEESMDRIINDMEDNI